MTSAEDFHILSLRNILGLSAVIVAVLIPVGLKRVFRKDLGELGEAEEELAEEEETERLQPVVDHAIDSGVCLAPPSTGEFATSNAKGKTKLLPTVRDEQEDDDAHDLYPVPVDAKGRRDIPTGKARSGYGTMQDQPSEVELPRARRWWLMGY